MSTTIKCPNCSFEFPLEEALNDELQDVLRKKEKDLEKERQQMRQQMIDYKKMKEDELLKQKQAQEDDYQKKLQEEIKKNNDQLETSIRKSLTGDYENRMNSLQKTLSENEEKLNASRKKEAEYLQKEQQLKTREAELEIELQKKLMHERELLKEQVKKEETEKQQLKETEHQLHLKELHKQLEDQKKLVDELKRKQEQGSMQMQGEVQELLLEEILRAAFPYDKIEEVGKGVRGADCIQIVHNQFGQPAGKIIYESKRTKDFKNEWIEKLKADMLGLGAEVAIIVTQALPSGMERFGERDGVYICTFTDVRSVALLLRNALLKIAETRKNQENRGDKMVMLYDYLTGTEFSGQWKAIREGFMSMKMSIQKERDTMEKLWKAREKQLEKVLLNAAHIQGSVEGIAGADAVQISLPGDEDNLLE